MPNVNGKKFPYTKEGMMDAKKAAKEKAKKAAAQKVKSAKMGIDKSKLKDVMKKGTKPGYGPIKAMPKKGK
jgi:hypothetical protein